MAVEVISTMASVGSWMAGSATVSTRTSSIPCHVTARMGDLLVRRMSSPTRAAEEQTPRGLRTTGGGAVRLPGDR